MTPAIKLLDQAGVPYQLHTYTHDASCTDYGMEAATKLQVEPQLIFKTLVVRNDTGTLALALVNVADRLDLKKLAQALHCKKADLADPAVAEKTTGYVVGGISPLGGRKVLPTLIDIRIEQLTSVYISSGKRGMQIELRRDDLVRLTNAQVVSIAVSGSGQ